MAASRVLADALHFQDRYQDAEIIYNEDLVILEQDVGPDYIKLLELSIRRSQSLILKQEYKTAEELLHRCLRLSEISHGPNDETTLGVLFKLIQCLRMYDILKAGPESTDASDGLFFLGLSYMTQNPRKLEPAVSTFQKCIHQRTLGLGSKHTATLITMFFLAMAYQELGNLSQAAELLSETSKDLLTSRPPPRTAFLTEVFKKQGSILWILGKYDLARAAYRCHLAAWLESESSDPPVTLSIRAHLPRAYTAILERDYNRGPESPVIAEWSGPQALAHFRGCDGCKGSPIYGTFYHCLICWETDLCASCFNRFQQSQPATILGGFPADNDGPHSL
ncbi:hypothetical protein MMC18_001768 [Xylographa bjoerkii]|nr:hypothetical protein [Xylographa bjoerkii]